MASSAGRPRSMGPTPSEAKVNSATGIGSPRPVYGSPAPDPAPVVPVGSVVVPVGSPGTVVEESPGAPVVPPASVVPVAPPGSSPSRLNSWKSATLAITSSRPTTMPVSSGERGWGPVGP